MNKKAEEYANKLYPDYEVEPYAYPNEIAATNYANIEQSLKRKAVVEGYKKGVENTTKTMFEWIEKNAWMYVNGEYNEFHHETEYDGTIDVGRLIKDLKKTLKDA